MESHRVRPEGTLSSTPESFRLSTLDHTVTENYMNWAIIFKLEDADDYVEAITQGFKRALGVTLGQCRHYVGKIEVNEHGDFSIVKKADSTVRFDVRRLDGPLFSELEAAKFSAASLGDHALFTIEGMTMSCGTYPHHIGHDVSAFQLTFVPGGMVFTIHQHHLLGDVFAASSFARQLAGNCSSVFKGTEPPSWDDALIDRARFITPPPSAFDDKTPLAPVPQKHPDWQPCSWLLFHIQEDKLVALKKLASPDDGTWISTYDAVMALIWRVLTKNRAPIYKHEPSSPAIFMEAVNMRSRLNPPVPEGYQGNLFCPGISFYQPDQLTTADVISDAPLSRLAGFVRKVTQSVTSHMLDGMLQSAAAMPNKFTLHGRADSVPPISLVVTDWRTAPFCTHDFGIGRPIVERLLCDTVIENGVVLYPPRVTDEEGNPDPSPGLEVLIPFETQAVDSLINDEEMKAFFEFRSIEATGP
ncbi:transferase family-domain-containing protein [Xylariaceae sp. FL0255]|nr:transferase family-domain-containing protein [Xylariaceae sp. FL0255]